MTDTLLAIFPAAPRQLKSYFFLACWPNFDGNNKMNFAKLSSRQTATCFGVPQTEVALWAREGAPCERTGEARSPLAFDSAKLYRWLIERAQFEGDPDSIAESKRRDREAAAVLKEFKVAELRKETISRTEACAIYSEHIAGFRARLFEMPVQIVGLTAEQRQELEDAINRALAEFSGLPKAANDTVSDDDDFG